MIHVFVRKDCTLAGGSEILIDYFNNTPRVRPANVFGHVCRCPSCNHHTPWSRNFSYYWNKIGSHSYLRTFLSNSFFLFHPTKRRWQESSQEMSSNIMILMKIISTIKKHHRNHHKNVLNNIFRLFKYLFCRYMQDVVVPHRVSTNCFRKCKPITYAVICMHLAVITNYTHLYSLFAFFALRFRLVDICDVKYNKPQELMLMRKCEITKMQKHENAKTRKSCCKLTIGCVLHHYKHKR